MNFSIPRSERVFAPSRILRIGILGVLGVALGAASVTARPTQPSATDRQITFAVATLMERTHLTGQMLDDKISERCLDTFVKELDPLKLFFYQSDIDEFKRNKTMLDDASSCIAWRGASSPKASWRRRSLRSSRPSISR